jgi:BlaI family penicillinase repressor
MTPPTDTELEVLKLFWRSGQMSAREVQGLAEPELGWAVSTTRTVLDRMTGKGLLDLKLVHGMKVYAPAQPKLEIIGGVLKRLVRGFLEIDGRLPAAAFTDSQLLSPEEVVELETILNSKSPED